MSADTYPQIRGPDLGSGHLASTIEAHIGDIKGPEVVAAGLGFIAGAVVTGVTLYWSGR